MSSKHTMLVMAPIALLLALLMSLLVAGRAEAQTVPEASEASDASEVALQDAGMFTGPEWAWDSNGKPVDPIDEGYKAHYTANNPSGFGAHEITSADYTVVEIDWPGVEEWQDFSSADEAGRVASDWASRYTNDDTCNPCADDVLVSTEPKVRSHIAKLTEQGWTADPSDGCECMYAPNPTDTYAPISDSSTPPTSSQDTGSDKPAGVPAQLPATGGPTISEQVKPAASKSASKPTGPTTTTKTSTTTSKSASKTPSSTQSHTTKVSPTSTTESDTTTSQGSGEKVSTTESTTVST